MVCVCDGVCVTVCVCVCDGVCDGGCGKCTTGRSHDTHSKLLVGCSFFLIPIGVRELVDLDPILLNLVQYLHTHTHMIHTPLAPPIVGVVSTHPLFELCTFLRCERVSLGYHWDDVYLTTTTTTTTTNKQNTIILVRPPPPLVPHLFMQLLHEGNIYLL